MKVWPQISLDKQLRWRENGKSKTGYFTAFQWREVKEGGFFATHPPGKLQYNFNPGISVRVSQMRRDLKANPIRRILDIG
jgi:hypothetical protein